MTGQAGASAAPQGWRNAALIALGAQALALFLTAGYALSSRSGPASWLDAGHHLLSGAVLLWWTLLLGRLTLARGVAPGEYLGRVHQALKLTFPLLTAIRGVLWGVTALAMLRGAFDAHPVALTAVMTVWGASVVASYMSYFWLVRWGELGPGRAGQAKGHLEDWLNLAAALSLGMTVINVVPITGFSVSPTHTDQLIYGLSGLLDVVATLLALQAVRLTRLPDPEGHPKNA